MSTRRSSAARLARRLAALAFLAVPAAVLPGCWPLAPIAAGIAAAGGGGGGSGNAGIVLSGTIVTDHSFAVSSLDLDREPNDSLGTSSPVGEVAPSRPVRIGGETAVRSTLHALVAGSGGIEVLRQELLEDGSARFAAAPPPASLARRGNELFWVERSEGGAQIRVTPLVSPFVKRRVPLGFEVEPAGAAVCLDALLVLDASAAGARLAAFDADDGRPLLLADLGRDGLAHLAGAEELSTGRTRLFTCAPETGELFEIPVLQNGADFRFGGLRSRGIPSDAADGIAALAWDGVLLHVVDGTGTLRSLEPDTLRTVASRRLLEPGERALSLVAHFELGLDGYRVDVPAGRTLSVDLAVTGAERIGGRFFLTAIERGSVAAERLPDPPQVWRTSNPSDRLRLELPAPSGAPRSFDVVVGALAGAGAYELALGRRAQSPARGPDVARGSAAEELGAWIEASALAGLASERLVELYRDPLLPDFAPGRIVLGRGEAGRALALPPAPKGFTLARHSSSPSGFDVVSMSTTPEFRGPAPCSLHGERTQRSLRREQARAVLAALDGIAGAAGVAWSEPLFVARSLAAPNDPGFAANQQWHYDLLNLQNAWDITTGATSTVMAVVDTGVRTDNGDLNANVGPDGYDFVTGTNNGDGNGIDPDPFDEGTFFTNGHHGSHTGGTMGAQGNNATLGTGICWDCTLMPVRALGTDGTGFTTDIADGINYAAGLANSSGTTPSQAAAVINLSLGLAISSNAIHNALIAAVNQGCVVMCAAGNDGNGTAVLFPAAHPEAIAVAAADPAGDIAFYSNTGPEIDITCSGGAASGTAADDVWSTVVVGGIGVLQPLAGTSMACAHASGIAGLMATVSAPLDQNTARSILTGTAIDIEAAGFDDFSGFGLVDAAAAVNGVIPVLDLSADSLDFGNTGSDLVVQASNAGGGNLVLTPAFVLTSTQTPLGVPPTTAWLTATLLSDGKTIHLEADRTGLAAGDYRIQVDVTSNGGNDSFLVGLTAGGGGVTDIGTVLVQVFAADGTTLVRSTQTTAASNYAWSVSKLSGVPYFVRCGVDLDGDGVLGEVGEPFGAYPNVTNQETLDLAGLGSLALDLLIE